MNSTIRRVTTVPPKQGPLTTPRTIYLLPAANNVQAPVQLQTKTLLAPRPSGVLIRTAPDSMVIRQNRVPEMVKSPSPMKTEVTLKRASNIPIEEILNETCSQPAMPRKRERLTHLSAEEKMNRRKLKNRVAAQTARDRKKERTSRLEDAVRRLFDENERLRADNASLRVRMDRLEARSEAENVNGAKCMATTFGSAASISGPQQREQLEDILAELQEVDLDSLYADVLQDECPQSASTSSVEGGCEYSSPSTPFTMGSSELIPCDEDFYSSCSTSYQPQYNHNHNYAENQSHQTQHQPTLYHKDAFEYNFQSTQRELVPTTVEFTFELDEERKDSILYSDPLLSSPSNQSQSEFFSDPILSPYDNEFTTEFYSLIE
ncbi:unnamed protein product, partial [Mesorhabditis belari]|uniref:X-box-binding protein 1 n=1 Tax=Mesorhabditis belari TaxID=2138241 RepID=A0AAF3J1S0_9BILA